MRLAEHTVVSAAYALADRDLTRALIPRIREETLALLGSAAPVPSVLLDEVLASSDPELRGALFSAARYHSDVFRRLALLGDPALAVHLHGLRDWERTASERAAVWEGAAATADDPAWHAKGALPGRLLTATSRDLLEPALLSPFPELVAYARRVLEHASTPAPPRTVSVPRPKPSPPAPGTTKELVGHLRDAHYYGEIELPTAPGALDWDELLAEHRGAPLTANGLLRLRAHPDCPEELALAAFEVNRVSQVDGSLHWSMLAAADEDRLAELLVPGIRSGAYPVDRVLREIGPARKVVCGLPHGHEGVRTALAAQVARLGSDFAPWRALHLLLPRFSGTVTELIDAALAETPKHLDQPWPKPVGPEFPSRGRQGGRAAWLHLYDAADHGTRCALTEHMDLRAIQQLLLRHAPSPELRAHIVRVRGASALAGIASEWSTSPEAIEELIPYNDPEVNAALFLHTNLTPAQRRHILSGRLWRDGHSADTPAADRIPLTEPLTDGLRESARRSWLLACCDSGDPLLCRVLLGSPRAKAHTLALELLMLLRLWERHGPDAVRELLDETDFPGRKKQSRHPLSPKAIETGRTALEVVGSESGLALLRAAYERAAGPVGRADFLCDKGAGSESDDLVKALAILVEEIGPGPMPWARLEAMHALKPLHDRVLVRLAEQDACPAALTEASEIAGLRLSHPEYRPRKAGRPPTASEMLGKYPQRLDRAGRCHWLEKAYHLGRITLPEVVRSVFPAQAAVAFLSTTLSAAPRTEAETEERREARGEVAALVAEHLSDNPEGWALALRLTPEFEGTLPDLLRASGAVLS
ncbi:hypothetical protein [Streptomyces sp. NPDC058653]|uniref:hypothetical protein n=1 Tax=Streptomyces sp. NPDC058653 TaxID=3346576 RepID=UPI003663527B